MKKYLRLSALAAASFALLAVTLSLTSVLFSEKAELPVKSEASYSAEHKENTPHSRGDTIVSVTSPVGKKYVLREYEDKIGVFSGGAVSPEYVIDVFVFTLPEETATALTKGIECSEDELPYLIEAFTS